MKKIILLAMSVIMALQVYSQELKFHNQQFKIVQFTDLHYIVGNPASAEAIQCLDEIINNEHPDLIMVTGDIAYSRPGTAAMQIILNTISAHKIPFAMTFGNHDGEQETPLNTLYDQIQKTPYNVQPARNGGNCLDYVLPIKSATGKTEALVYGFDTHNQSKMKDVRGYQWLTFDQIKWYREKSAAYNSQNGAQVLPALAFLHIPLPEYNMAIDDQENILYGTRMEKNYCPSLNSGMFTAMKECGDVMGIFCGHDHDDDYAVNFYNVLLAYGRFSGGNTEYNHLRNGARVIVLKENKREFDTWIHERGGQILYKTTFPSSYIKDNWKERKGVR